MNQPRPDDVADRRSPASADLPVACSLGPQDGARRMARWQRLSDTAAPIARRAGRRLEVRYQARPGVREELETLAVAETQCCSFVAWQVSDVDGDPVLHVTARPDSPEDVAPIAALFGVS